MLIVRTCGKESASRPADTCGCQARRKGAGPVCGRGAILSGLPHRSHPGWTAARHGGARSGRVRAGDLVMAPARRLTGAKREFAQFGSRSCDLSFPGAGPVRAKWGCGGNYRMRIAAPSKWPNSCEPTGMPACKAPLRSSRWDALSSVRCAVAPFQTSV